MGDVSVIYLRCADYRIYIGTDLSEELPKNGDHRSPRSSQLAASVCHRQADRRVWPPLPTEPCISVRQWPERLGIGAGNRSIEEVY